MVVVMVMGYLWWLWELMGVIMVVVVVNGGPMRRVTSWERICGSDGYRSGNGDGCNGR